MSDEILTKQDLADALKCNIRTIDNMIKRNEIKYYKIGRLVRFKKSDIDEYMSRKTVDAAIKSEF